ncbi:MAG: hypothetical protein K2J72_01010, partial [Oscillospiraceae bacterium]|nr:hypothetical protein [Oscillospiraceae bacterium]
MCIRARVISAAVKFLVKPRKDNGLLKIVYSGTTSMGSYAKYTISDNTVLIECEEIDRHHFSPIAIDFGWKFKPIHAGNCTIITEQWDCGDFSFAEIYDVTVDENLDIRYSKHKAEKLNAFSHYMNTYTYDVSVSCDKGGETKIFSADETENFNNEIDRLYGINTDCEKPDLSGMTKITVDYKYLDDYEHQSVIYLNDGKIYYPHIRYEVEYWAEFTPDEFCSLDGINELLGLKD